MMKAAGWSTQRTAGQWDSGTVGQPDSVRRSRSTPICWPLWRSLLQWWLSGKWAKPHLNQTVVQPPPLLSTVIESSADSAVSSPAGETLGFYNWTTSRRTHLLSLLCGNLLYSHSQPGQGGEIHISPYGVREERHDEIINPRQLPLVWSEGSDIRIHWRP